MKRWIVGVAAVVAFGVLPANTNASIDYQVEPLYTTALVNYKDPIYTPPSFFNGVAMLNVTTNSGTLSGSAVLLPDGKHILTAAHLVTDGHGNLVANAAQATFQHTGGPWISSVVGYDVYPGWDGNVMRGDDIAVLELASAAPLEVSRYDIYRGSDEVGQVGNKAGWGWTGSGSTGQVAWDGKMRQGLNKYDALADVMMLDSFRWTPGLDYVPGAVLQYDFDNGLAQNDAFGFFFGLDDLGVGEREVMGASGDSGGPTFIDGKIAGIASYRITLWNADKSTSDIDLLAQPLPTANSSFGEFVGDMRVSYYASWIDSIVAIPEPASLIIWSLLGALGITIVGRRWRRAA